MITSVEPMTRLPQFKRAKYFVAQLNPDFAKQPPIDDPKAYPKVEGPNAANQIHSKLNIKGPV